MVTRLCSEGRFWAFEQDKHLLLLGLPRYLSGKEYNTIQDAIQYNTRDASLIPGSGRFPGEGMATYSSILGWKIPWTEEPGRPQSMGSERVGHD